MLYDGSLKFMALGKMAIEEKNIQEAHNNIMRALDIISELDNTLNMDIPLSNDMHRLYDFVIDRLVNANMYKKAEYIDEARDVITDIRDGWKEAMVTLKRGK